MTGATDATGAADVIDAFADLDLQRAAADGPVAFGAGLAPEVLLAAYRHGLFPMPAHDEYAAAFNEARHPGARLLPGPLEDPYELAWWSPDPRPVLTPDGVRLPGRLARRLRNRPAWRSSADRAFERVVAQCAEGRQPPWLTGELQRALIELHRRGEAHSGEVWEDGELVGGVFGVRAGPVLSLDSMFHRRPDAARVAVADLARRFAEAGGRLLDAQWDGPHVRSLGAAPLPRARYLAALAEPAEVTRLPGEERPVRWLAPGG